MFTQQYESCGIRCNQCIGKERKVGSLLVSDAIAKSPN